MVQLSHSNASKASIPPVSCTKDPGLLFQDTLKFNQNIANLATKANKILGSALKTIHSRYTYHTLLPRLRALRPEAGQLKILRFFGKQNRQKRAHAPFF